MTRDSDSNAFFELRNWGDEAVDLTGWEVYRCTYKGTRKKVGQTEGELTGVVLQPGEIHTVSRIGLPGDDHISSTFDLTGFGLYLEAPDDTPVDLVGVFPNEPWPMQSECTPTQPSAAAKDKAGSGNLPNILDFAQNESWQRVAATGDPARDWIVAPSTIAAPNATRAPAAADSVVVVSELAGAGPDGADDDFVELRNDGAEVEDISGWQLYRCTATGRIRPDTLQLTIPTGTRLDPGDTWVAAAEGFSGDADARYPRPLADREFGILVRTADAALVDRVAVTAYGDSACQGETKLPSTLDMPRGESYQRTADGGYLVAPRTPGAANADRPRCAVRLRLSPTPRAEPGGRDQRGRRPIPSLEGMPAGTVQRNYIELGNYGTEPVDVGGWTIWRCMADGARAAEPQVTIPAGTELSPGGVFLAAREGTAAEAEADAVYDTALSLLGAGVWVSDADGNRVDSVGVYAANVFDAPLVTPSPCTKGLSLTTFQPDRLLEETFQRSRFTGVDADDFVVAAATPGRVDEIPYVDPTLRLDVIPDFPDGAPVAVAEEVAEPTGTTVTILEAWGGTTEAGALTTLEGDGETALDPANPGELRDDAYGYPYQRLILDADEMVAGSTVSWSGTGEGRSEVQLSVWTGENWRLLDAGTGNQMLLTGLVEERDVRDRRVTLLVQNGPRTHATMASGIDGEAAEPVNVRLRDLPHHRHPVPDRGVPRGLRGNRRAGSPQTKPGARSRSPRTPATSPRTTSPRIRTMSGPVGNSRGAPRSRRFSTTPVCRTACCPATTTASRAPTCRCTTSTSRSRATATPRGSAGRFHPTTTPRTSRRSNVRVRGS